jgi:hypothetical protein
MNISDNEYHRAAFAFSAGLGENAGKSDGKNTIDHCKLLIPHVLGLDSRKRWEVGDEKAMAMSIKNRVIS